MACMTRRSPRDFMKNAKNKQPFCPYRFFLGEYEIYRRGAGSCEFPPYELALFNETWLDYLHLVDLRPKPW